MLSALGLQDCSTGQVSTIAENPIHSPTLPMTLNSASSTIAVSPRTKLGI